MSTVKERLMEFLKSERISRSEFSRRMNLSPAYLSSMRKSMPEEKVERLIREFPQLNRDWLLYGEGSMLVDSDKDVDVHRMHRHMVPLIPFQARAGALDQYVKGVMVDECPKVYSPVEGADLAIYVRGDSMEPKIPNGSMIIVEKINDRLFIPWGKPVLIDTDNGSVVKALYPSEKSDEYWEARSYNPAYPPYDIPKESIIGIYRIRCVVNDGDSL